jgi:DNA invertase Pin-like site-specific DNA recombinase
LARKAIVYLRQSSDKQVRQNKESQLLQYAVAERVRALGWAGRRSKSSTVTSDRARVLPPPSGKASSVSSAW